MQAEKLSASTEQRRQLLDESAELLQRANDEFDELLRNGGRRFVEDRGECIALLARTYATMFDLDLADDAVERAGILLAPVPTGKAAADVTILRAELLLLRARRDGGELDPDAWTEHVEALGELARRHARNPHEPLDRSASEIAARAHLVLGQFHERSGVAGFAAAKENYEAAADLYERLRYLAQEKSALWRAMLISGEAVPAALIEALDEIDAADGARLLAVTEYLDQRPSTTSVGDGRIAETVDLSAGDAYWVGLARDAVARYVASAPSWTEGRAEGQTA